MISLPPGAGGGSVRYFDVHTAQFIEDNCSPADHFLDVGAGKGKWGRYVSGSLCIDAVEINPLNVERYELHKFYRNVFVEDIRTFVFPEDEYNFAIFGDVLEHMSVADAQAVLQKCMDAKVSFVVHFPYMWPEGHLEEDDWEVHEQPDLTREIVLERYPCLTLLIDDDAIGVFYHIDWRRGGRKFRDKTVIKPEYIPVPFIKNLREKEEAWIKAHPEDGLLEKWPYVPAKKEG